MSAAPRIVLAGTLAAGALLAGTWTLTTLRHRDDSPAGGTLAVSTLPDPPHGGPAPPSQPAGSEIMPRTSPPLIAPAPSPAARSAGPMVRSAGDSPPEAAVPAARPRLPPAILEPARAARSFDRGPVEQPAVMLTFDAGSHRTGAAEILDALATAGVRTTFFLTGEFIRDHPDLVLRITAEGHEVGNHTETHLHLTQWEDKRRHTTRPEIDKDRLLAELERTQAAFHALTGQHMAPLWRAPYGEHNPEILRWAADAGWAHVGWTPSMDTLDWVTDTESRLYRDADEIARRLLALPDRDAHGGHGAIVLMHLGSERPEREQLGRILPSVLAGYRSRGLKILTASAMMQGS